MSRTPRETLFTGPSDGGFFDHFAHTITRVTGSPYAFMTALVVVLGWAACGPVFGFSNTWQLVINTSTTIVTFLMVFVIQQSQNKDTVAIQLKLNELIATTKGASNRLIDVEDLTDKELDMIKRCYVQLAAEARAGNNAEATHSLSEFDGSGQRKLDSGGTSKGPQR